MFGTSRDVRRTTGSLAGLALVGEVCAEKDPPEQCNGMAGGRDSACSALFAPTSELLCFFSSELRILLLCGSDLLESFCIPGLWNEADVSHYHWAPLRAPPSSSSASHTQHSWEPLRSLGMAGTVLTIPTASSIPTLTLTSPTQGQPEGQGLLLQGHQPYPLPQTQALVPLTVHTEDFTWGAG